MPSSLSAATLRASSGETCRRTHANWLRLPSFCAELQALAIGAVAERAAERRDGRRRVFDVGRHRVDRVGVGARRQHAAAPIEDVAAFAGRLLVALLLPLGALDQIAARDDLQVDEAALDGDRPEREQAGGDADAFASA